MNKSRTDSITTCRKCGSPSCYEVQDHFVISYKCLHCGFETNTMLLEGTDAVLAFEKDLPTLFTDIKHVDPDGFVWYPQVINIPNKGMVFPDPINNNTDWNWACVFAVPVEEHEKERFKKPGKPGEYYSYKMNYATVLHFDKLYFFKALETIGGLQ